MSELNYVRVCAAAEIADGSSKGFCFGKLCVGLFHSDGKYYAVNDLCTHADERLSGGWVEGHVVECPKHAAQFDLRTGEALALPAVDPVEVYPVEVRGDDIYIGLPSGEKSPMKSIEEIRADFPILNLKVNSRPLVYLDSAASAQKPMQVLNAYCRFCESRYSNVHRGVHTLAESATADYEAARKTVAEFVNADPRGIVFTRGTTESINLVAHSFGRKFIKSGQAILLSPMEHHANLVPWQLIAQFVGAELRFWPMTADGTLDLDGGKKLLDSSVALVAITHISNVLGTINPVREIAEMAHRVGAKILIDGAQSVPHIPVDFAEINADFYAFSAHKMCGPTGMEVLWGKPELLDSMDPFMTGGEIIREVWLDHATWNEIPHKFEAGTPPITEAVSLAAAVRYLQETGMHHIESYDRMLTEHAMERLTREPGVTVCGPAQPRGALVTFNVAGVHPHDLAALLDREGIAIRAGHHCAQPLMRHLGVTATARASFYLYNTVDEMDALIDGIRTVKKVLHVD